MHHNQYCLDPQQTEYVNSLVSLIKLNILAMLLAGGWLQVAVKHMPMSSLIVGVDLVPIRPIRGAKTIIGDITSAQCRQVRSCDISH